MNEAIDNIDKSETKVASLISRLIALKCERDNTKFTCYKLAKETGVDRSLLQRLLNGEVENPRLDTFLKIINYFISDGFNLNINDIVPWTTKSVAENANIHEQEQTTHLSLYQMENFNGGSIGSTNVLCKPSEITMNTIAIVSSHTIPPLFNPGSLFIVELNKKPKQDNLVIVERHRCQQVAVAKYKIVDDIPKLSFIFPDEQDISLIQLHGKIIGVVKRINIKT